MKRVFTFATVLLIMSYSNMFSAENVIVLGETYTNDVWFSFTNGILKTEPTDNWDIGFQTNSQNGGIIINSAKGVALYVVQNSDGDSWDTPIDTTGMSSGWAQGYNSNETWNVGAFNLGLDGFVSGGDFGWGMYDMSTHAIAGNKVYVIKLNKTTFKKTMIESLLSGTYTCLVADLDGTNESKITIKKSDYMNNLYTYIDLSDNSIIEREPSYEKWDLVFSKYTDLIDMGNGTFTPYTVTGVRTHPLYRTAIVQDVPTDESVAPPISDENYTPYITAIGSDWKTYDLATDSYNIVENLSYFATLEQNGASNPKVNKIVFTQFEGSSTGKIVFELNGGGNSVDDALVNSLNIFPTIVDKSSKVSVDPGDYRNQSLRSLKLFNTAGNVVSVFNSNQILSDGKFEISLSDLATGEYFMVFEFENTNLLKKIIVK